MKDYVVSVTKILCKKVLVSASGEEEALSQAMFEYKYNSSSEYDRFCFDERKDLSGVEFKVCKDTAVVDGRC